MARNKRTFRGWFSWLNDWAWPFLWILLIPAVTVPLQQALLWQEALPGVFAGTSNCQRSGEYWEAWECPVGDVLPTLLPGLLNLVPFLWLLSPVRRTRYAAAVAGTLGAVRVVVPAIIYVASGTTVVVDPFLPTTYVDLSFEASWLLWGLSLVATLVFARLGRDSQHASRPKG